MSQKADTTTTLVLRSDDRTHYSVPAHGFVERIELRPRVDVPNMDASRSVEIVVDVIDTLGNRVPLDVFVIARDVL